MRLNILSPAHLTARAFSLTLHRAPADSAVVLYLQGVLIPKAFAVPRNPHRRPPGRLCVTRCWRSILQFDVADVRGFARSDGGILECDPRHGDPCPLSATRE